MHRQFVTWWRLNEAGTNLAEHVKSPPNYVVGDGGLSEAQADYPDYSVY